MIRSLDMEALKTIGSSQRFPFKGSIANGRFYSPNLKREVGDSLLRNMDELKAEGQRLKLPAKSSCHQGRWYSGSLKAQVENKLYSDIDELARNVKILVISGERRQESAGRAKYNEMESHRTNATAKTHRTFTIFERTALMEKYFAYLDWLRHTSVTNMYGARPYLQQTFPELSGDPKRASEILRAWMDSYWTKGGNSK